MKPIIALLTENIVNIFKSKEFVWETPRTEEYANSKKCRFKRKIQT
jgi:hypothetical protein